MMRKHRIAFNNALIAQVERNPALWDATDPNHKDSKLVHTIWTAIAFAMESSVNVVQDRWRNLRDTYMKNLRKVQSLPSNVNGQKPRPRWIHFEQLNFLRKTITARNISEDKNFASSIGDSILEEDGAIEEITLDAFSDCESDTSRKKWKNDLSHSEFAANKRKFQEEILQESQSNSTKMKCLQKNVVVEASYSKPDDTEMFLLSLVPSMQQIDKDLTLPCRLSVMYIINQFSKKNLPVSLPDFT